MIGKNDISGSGLESDLDRAALDALLDDAEIRLSERTTTAPVSSDSDGLLSIAQTYLWSYSRIDPSNPAHNRSTAFSVHAAFDKDRLADALDALIARHPELRASFPSVDELPRRIDSELDHLPFDVVDLREYVRQSELGPSMHSFVHQPFTLGSGPLIRARVFRISDDEFVVHLVIHHIIFDAWSAGILKRDLRDLYLKPDSPDRLPRGPETASYSDYVAGQRHALQNGTIENLVTRTVSRLEGAPTILELLADRKRPARRSGNGVTHSVQVDAGTLAEAEAFAVRHAVTLPMLLSAVFSLFLHRYTGLDDILVGVPYAGRDEPRFERTVGLLMNFLVLRARLHDNPSFADLLVRIRADSLEMMSTARAPFELVARRLHPDRDPGQTPLVQALFNTEVDRDTVEVRSFEHDPTLATHDLSVEAIRGNDGLALVWVGNADIFEVDTMSRMARHFGNLLEGAVRSPETRIDAIPLTAPHERRDLLDLSAAPDEPYPHDKPLHVLFEEWVLKTPEKIAVFDGDTTISYRELNERANQLAHFLIGQGVGREDLVPVFLERSPELVVAWIAVSKSGAAFIGLDPQDPTDRIRWIADDVNAPCIITDSRRASEMRDRDSGPPIIELPSVDLLGSSRSNPDVRVDSGDASSVLYTSGSTGTPKGVLSAHKSLSSLVFRTRHFPFDSRTVTFLMSSPSFDAALNEVWGPLIRGGSMVVHRGQLPSARAIKNAITRFGVNDIWLTSSLFNVIVDESLLSLKGLDHVRTGGETVSVEHAIRAARALPETAILNWYGPTEATVIATSFRVPINFPEDSPSIPIGKPVAGRHVYILDQNLEPVPIGVPGEVYIGCIALATCYVNDVDLTTSRFVPDPFASEDGARMYRTGDLARFLPSGDITFLGRIDRQIKLRGVRIELGEIESVIAAHDLVKECSVVVSGTSPDRKSLVAVFATHDGKTLPPGILRDYLKRRLSRHLVPAEIIHLEKLPHLPSGKIDTRSILKQVPQIDVGDSTTPSSEIEHRLAKIWAKVLDQENVGITRDFFELGGDSLAAVRLFSAIEKVFDVEIPISSIFDASTIREQAVILDVSSHPESWSPLINVKPSGSWTPFFIVPMVNLVHLKKLGEHLPEEQPLFGLQAPQLWNRRRSHTTIEQMAEDYHREILRQQPSGPYQLGGVCMGSIVALEIAKRLVAEGRNVRCLIAFDTIRPPVIRNPAGELPTDVSLGEVEEALARIEPSSKGPRKAPKWFRILKRKIRKAWRDDNRGWKNTMTHRVMYSAREMYESPPYSGRIDVLKSEKPDRLAMLQSGWKHASTNEVRFWPVTGTHSSMWDEAHIENTAAVMMEIVQFRRGDEAP